MTEILTENQVCYWLVVGILLGAAIVGVFVGRYIYDITSRKPGDPAAECPD